MRRTRNPLWCLGASLLVALLAVGAGSASAAATRGAGGAAAPSESGGAQYGQVLAKAVDRPVASLLTVPDSVVSGVAPKIAVRIDHPHDRRVTARIVVLRMPGGDPAARIALGRIQTGRKIAVRWPKGVTLAEGQYVVRVHAKDSRNHVLVRKARAAGLATMTVTPAPVVPLAPVTPATPVGDVVPGGVFPVAGAYTFGDGIGEARSGHTHQGQDVLTAEGTPVLAPTAGTITVTSYQASAAGYYVVEQSTDGRSFFFAHCQKDSFGAEAGEVVAAGTQVCRAGSTGDAKGSHLHFEIWVDGWRTSAKSHFVDPLAQLKAWAGQ